MSEMCFNELAPDDKDEFKEMGNMIKDNDKKRKHEDLRAEREDLRAENDSTPAAPKRAPKRRARRNQRRRGRPGPGNAAGSNLHFIFLLINSTDLHSFRPAFISFLPPTKYC